MGKKKTPFHFCLLHQKNYRRVTWKTRKYQQVIEYVTGFTEHQCKYTVICGVQ